MPRQSPQSDYACLTKPSEWRWVTVYEARLANPTCICGVAVNAKGLHGLSCRKSSPRQIRHAQLNDIVWRSVKKAQYLAVKEPVGLSRSDGQRPDGATLIP